MACSGTALLLPLLYILTARLVANFKQTVWYNHVFQYISICELSVSGYVKQPYLARMSGKCGDAWFKVTSSMLDKLPRNGDFFKEWMVCEQLHDPAALPPMCSGYVRLFLRSMQHHEIKTSGEAEEQLHAF
jgi:hypothetical protein